jgi:hypothetical protein
MQAYYQRLHRFSYPEATDAQVAVLCAEIQAAFADTPYPGDDQLCGSSQGDEPAEDALELRGLSWQSIHPQLLARCYTALSFLSDAGLRYYLPAFLLADVHYHASNYAPLYESNAEPVYELTRGLDGEHTRRAHQVTDAELEALVGKEQLAFLARFEPTPPTGTDHYATTRLQAFTRPERLAIIHYLEYRATVDDYEAPSIHAALENYWRPSVGDAALAPVIR